MEACFDLGHQLLDCGGVGLGNASRHGREKVQITGIRVRGIGRLRGQFELHSTDSWVGTRSVEVHQRVSTSVRRGVGPMG